jgi:predicted nucleic acid-binding Zn ribbon protein
MPLADYQCPECAFFREDVLLKSSEPDPFIECSSCGTRMERCPPRVATPVFTAGRSAESRAAWGAKEKARLQKRSDDYDRSPRGSLARQEQIAKLQKNGTIPPGMKV